MNTMIDRVHKTLNSKSGQKGLTPATVAKRAKVSKENVYRIVYDLREEGFTINSRTNKRGQTIYQMAA